MALEEQIRTMRTKVATLTNNATAKYAELEAKGDAATGEERTALNAMIDEGTTARKELERLLELKASDDLVNKPAGQARATAHTIAGLTPRRSWGQKVVGSDQYERARKGSTIEAPKMDRVNVKAEQKALYEGSAAAGGALVNEQRVEELIGIPHRPQSILNLITVSRTTSNVVEWVEMASRTNGAAPVAEYTSGNFGLKPESNMTFALKTTPVKTVATWIGASRLILQDAPRLQDLVDTDLTEMVRIVLENQIVAGDGTGENFTGILNTAGIQTRTQGSGARALAGDTVADTIRRAITDIQLEFYEPNGILLSPTDAEEIELLKDDNKQYVKIWDPTTGRLWRVAVTVNPILTANSGLVGDFRMGATLWDRMETEIRVGEPNDFFLRNAVAILAELRAAFAVVRPKAIEAVTFVDPA
jgi:HK97 family phage major capsid protein